MTRPDHMEKARDIESGFECDWTADGRRRGEAEEEAAVVAIARALAAAEQRGREDAAKVAESVGSDHDPQLGEHIAAAIRRGDGTAPPSSSPEQNGESATPSHAPTPEGKG